MLGPFATASRRTPHCHSPGVATVARRHCRTPLVHRCAQQRRRRQQQRQRVTEGTAMPHRMGPITVSHCLDRSTFGRAGLLAAAVVGRIILGVGDGEEISLYQRAHQQLVGVLVVSGRRAAPLQVAAAVGGAACLDVTTDPSPHLVDHPACQVVEYTWVGDEVERRRQRAGVGEKHHPHLYRCHTCTGVTSVQ